MCLRHWCRQDDTGSNFTHSNAVRIHRAPKAQHTRSVTWECLGLSGRAASSQPEMGGGGTCICAACLMAQGVGADLPCIYVTALLRQPALPSVAVQPSQASRVQGRSSQRPDAVHEAGGMTQLADTHSMYKDHCLSLLAHDGKASALMLIHLHIQTRQSPDRSCHGILGHEAGCRA